MMQLINVFWDICRLKTGPQNLPTGYYLLGATILAGIIVDSFTSSIFMPNLSGLTIFKIVAIYNVLMFAMIYLLLTLLGYANRGIQTLTAFAGSGLFITLILLPGLLVINSAGEQTKSFAFYILIDSVWRLSVNAHIFRHALSVNFLLSMILSLSYFIIGLYVGDFLIPTQAQ